MSAFRSALQRRLRSARARWGGAVAASRSRSSAEAHSGVCDKSERRCFSALRPKLASCSALACSWKPASSASPGAGVQAVHPNAWDASRQRDARPGKAISGVAHVPRGQLHAAPVGWPRRTRPHGHRAANGKTGGSRRRYTGLWDGPFCAPQQDDVHGGLITLPVIGAAQGTHGITAAPA